MERLYICIKCLFRLFLASLSNRNLAELLEELRELQRSLAGASTGSLVILLYLSGSVSLEQCDLCIYIL